ncbi:MAG: tetratricopeptide repeat protein [Nannocystaceae bacterium]|nr:tetratricopeptide repeat protein [Nannocystaceae bacterium]
MNDDACLQPDDVVALMAGELDDAEQARIELHLDRCEVCRELVAWVARAPMLAPSRMGPRSEPVADELDVTGGRSLPLAVTELQQALAPGATLGRYVVREVLGRGGMGVVYDAWDPQLDRRVALKLLRARPQRTAEGRARLQREARAIAALSHPNVVAVYDVGTATLPDGSEALFVAMAHVEGPTLRRWLDERERPWRAIAAVFLGAARGLLAAHELGIVHRDFKPGNVIVAPGDRAIVLDFGLATVSQQPVLDPRDRARASGGLGDERDASVAEPWPAPDEARVTQTDALLGTPAYMAPEQRRGAQVDARADQYAWALGFGEALVRAHPFVEPSSRPMAELLAPARVPRALRRLLVRATATAPSQRFGSMFEVVEALEAVLQRSRTRAVLAAAGAVALLYAGWIGAQARGEGTVARCEGGARAMASVWNDERRTATAAAFSGAAPWLSRTRDDVLAGITAYVERWIDHRDASCRAFEQGRGDARELDAQMLCFARARTELDTLLQSLAEGPQQSQVQALAAVDALPDPQACDDAGAREQPLPDDPATREAVQQVATLLAQAHAWERTGAIARAREALDEAVALARRSGHAATEADARVAWARQAMAAGELDAAERELLAASWAAESVADARRTAQARIELIWLEGYFRNAFDRAQEHGDAAAEALARIPGGDPTLAVVRLRNLAWTDAQHGRAEAAAAGFRAAITACEAAPDCGRDALLLQSDLATVLLQLGDIDAAEAASERVREATEAWLGPDHPELAAVLNNLGAIARERGEFERALTRFDRAIEILAAAWGEQHVLVARARLNRGTVLADLGRHDEAQGEFEAARAVFEHDPAAAQADLARAWKGLAGVAMARWQLDAAAEGFRRALALESAALGEQHPSVAVTCTNLGVVETELEHYPEAIALHERAAAILRATVGPQHPHLVVVLDGLAVAQERAGQIDRAIATVDEALAIATATDSPNLAQALLRRGQLELARADARAARDWLERAVAAFEAAGAGDPIFAAQARFALARSLPATEHRRAVALARAALAATPADDPLAADVQAWLDAEVPSRSRGTTMAP